MRIDLHMHTVFSDGELIPAEIARRAMVLDHKAIAITDHVDATNVEFVVSNMIKAIELSEDYIKVIPGVEITHVPPSRIDQIARIAKGLGAKWVIVHGETIAEPVMPGTNLAAAESDYVDLIAHPGLITEEIASIVKGSGKHLEISGRKGHSLTNGHVANIARKVGAKTVVNSDAHAPGDLMNMERATKVAMGAGMNEDEIKAALVTVPEGIIKRL